MADNTGGGRQIEERKSTLWPVPSLNIATIPSDAPRGNPAAGGSDRIKILSPALT